MQRVGAPFLFTLAIGCTASGGGSAAGANRGTADAALEGGGGALGGGGASDGSLGGNPFSWSQGTPCPLERFEAGGAVIGGELWVLGGFVSSGLDVTRRVDIYDPSSDSWRLGPDLPSAETHLGVVTVGSDIVVIGGFDGKGNAWTTTSAVWRWRAADAAWTAGPDLPSARAAVASAIIGTEIHAAGGLAVDGNSDLGDHVVWDLAGGASWTSASPLPEPRNHGGGAASGGLFFAIAGRHGWDETAGDSDAVDAFDPTTATWTNRAPIPIARSEIGGSTTTMSDGRLLVIGGSVAGVHPNADVLIYDPSADQWLALPPLPEPRKGAVAARIGATIVVSTGSPTSTDPSDTTFIGCCL